MDKNLAVIDEGLDPEMVELSCCLTAMLFL